MAAFFPVVDKVFTVTQESWFNEVVELAWAPPPYEPQRAMYAYAASKVQAEKGLWEFVRTGRPGFVLNTGMYVCMLVRDGPAVLEFCGSSWSCER